MRHTMITYYDLFKEKHTLLITVSTTTHNTAQHQQSVSSSINKEADGWHRWCSSVSCLMGAAWCTHNQLMLCFPKQTVHLYCVVFVRRPLKILLVPHVIPNNWLWYIIYYSGDSNYQASWSTTLCVVDYPVCCVHVTWSSLDIWTLHLI